MEEAAVEEEEAVEGATGVLERASRSRSRAANSLLSSCCTTSYRDCTFPIDETMLSPMLARRRASAGD